MAGHANTLPQMNALHMINYACTCPRPLPQLLACTTYMLCSTRTYPIFAPYSFMGVLLCTLKNVAPCNTKLNLKSPPLAG